MLFHISILLSVLYRLSSLLAGITILQRRHLILKRWIFVKFFVHGQITPLLYNAFTSPHSQIILLEKISKSVSTNLIIIKKKSYLMQNCHLKILLAMNNCLLVLKGQGWGCCHGNSASNFGCLFCLVWSTPPGA